jgi:Lon protease-like protein
VSDAPFPESFPIFPLPDVVLFPDVRLPLHIFEPRYRAITRDTLRSSRVIGMTLLRPRADAAAKRADVFEVGCAGRIVECRQLPDGRFNMVLAGERRFRIRRELETDDLYRCIEAELLDDPPIEALDATARSALETDRESLLESVLAIARASIRQQESPSVEELEQRMRQLDSIQLVHALAFGLDTSPLEKQGLLEAPDAVARSRMLIRLFEFRRAQQRHPDSPDVVH